MGKDEETDLRLRRKAARVFGENHKDRWTATKYQSRQPFSLKEFRETQRWLKLIQHVPLIKKPELLNDILEETEELIKIFVTSIKTAEKKQK